MNATRIVTRCSDCDAPIETHAGGHAHLCDDCRRERRNGRNLAAWHGRNTNQPERFRVARYTWAATSALGRNLACATSGIAMSPFGRVSPSKIPKRAGK